MIIVALTDIHGNVPAVDRVREAVAQADVVLLTGDLTHFGRRADAAAVVDAVRRHNPRILAVPGNCDNPDVTAYLSEQGVSLHGAHAVVGGVAFLGLGGSLPCPGRTPTEFTEDQLTALLSAAATGLTPDLPWVLVSHQPPRDTALDRVHSGLHVGSSAVRDFIAAHEPLVCFTGHIHEAVGTDSIGATKIVNPGPLRNGRYAYAQVTRGLELLEIRGA